jgi:hypothetical protein
MKLILSRTQALAATAVVLGLLTMLPGQSRMLPPRPVSVERSPDDAPCHISKSYPDGTWEISLPHTSYQTLTTVFAGGSFLRDASEANVIIDSSACRHAAPRKFASGWEA